ncbi:chlorophyll synthesis pathway protein BchC [Rhodovibrio salinarum]|uniref:Chlorophyll synthesis pathway protein BchC n=1 Tax=Rhodovibrio salinarum TaxID=1087 RepID=A0A934QG53_9PROT|nr:chlorophyll synthesis pathway protein BchC [Rhodovibrio salinarum]MBK1696351.1 chlorophyll synthesis pathway protein BchC [Rhodovibrio salinarum]
MNATAVVLEEPEKLALSRLDLAAPAAGDIVVDMEVSGISTGTERLLWTGQMPHFPGMGYPLVPGYEALGRVSQADGESGLQEGDRVFVPGARCFGDVRGLFGGAASRVVVPASRVVKVSDDLGEGGVLLALAATAYHALQAKDAKLPELIVGHGTLGRLLARVTLALGGESPVVWEADPARREGAQGYTVVAPEDDGRRDYSAIYDVSGDAGLLDELIGRLAFGGEVVLAGFYSDRPSFAFPQAFMREARIRIAAEWRESDLHATRDLAESGALSLDGLITHRRAATDAEQAYRTAFGDSACLKMVLDWRGI